MLAIKHEGIVTVIGILTGVEPAKASVLDALLNICTFRGIHIGSRDQMEEMMAAIEANGIQPVLDKRVFKLEELREGLEYMVSALYYISSENANIMCRKLESILVRL